MSRLGSIRDQELRSQRTRTREQERAPERLSRLDPEDLKALRNVGAFRIVDKKDLPESSVKRLEQRQLVRRRTLYQPKSGERHEILSLTKKGKQQLDQQRDPHDKQRYWIGAVKPREMNHDLQIYRAYQKEAARIESQGGKVNRVALDYEFKQRIYKESNKKGVSDPDKKRREMAQDLELPVIDGKVLMPDARIEYTDEHGEEQHLDIEVMTEKYRGSMRKAKHASGFKLHSSTDPRMGVIDDHEMEFL